MPVRNRVFVGVGILLSLWMGAGRWAFGIGGDLTLWYLPLITLPYAILQIWAMRRLRITADRGRRAGRAPYVALAISWLCAIGFGFTVPDMVGGELVSVLSYFGGSGWSEMSIALCNPFGIIAFAAMIIAIAYAAAAGRDPRPEEDEIEEGGMVPHPLDYSN